MAQLSAAPRPVTRGAKWQPTRVGVDWLRLTIPAGRLGRLVALVQRVWRCKPTRERGKWFYASAFRFTSGVQVLFDDDNADGGHACLECPGGALKQLTHTEIERLIYALVAMGAKATRIDIALDWFRAEDDQIDVVQCASEAADENAVCGFRTSQRLVSQSRGECTGETVTFGRRGSNGSGKFYRFYDKGLETKTETRGKWQRVEVEFSDYCAAEVLRQIGQAVRDGQDTRWLLKGLVVGSIDFREAGSRNDRHLSRRPRLAWWAAFIAGIERVRVRVERERATLDSYVKYFRRCIAPTIGQLAATTGRTVEAIFNDLVPAEERNSFAYSAIRPVVYQYLMEHHA